MKPLAVGLYERMHTMHVYVHSMCMCIRKVENELVNDELGKVKKEESAPIHPLDLFLEQHVVPTIFYLSNMAFSFQNAEVPPVQVKQHCFCSFIFFSSFFCH